MKITRRMTALSVVLALLAMMLMPARAVGVTGENPYEIQNDEARRLYNALVETSRTQRANNEEFVCQTSSVTSGLEEEAEFAGDFEVLSLAVGDEDDKQIVYEDTDTKLLKTIEKLTRMIHHGDRSEGFLWGLCHRLLRALIGLYYYAFYSQFASAEK